MQYRKNIKNSNELSSLGFGLMRLPTKAGSIDYENAKKLVIKAIDNGVNYFDTAYIYHKGQSEKFFGRVLEEEGLRDKVNIATKLPIFLVKKPKDFDGFFNKQLANLQTDYIDYYLLHMLGDVYTWQKLVDFGIIDWVKEKKEQGIIKNFGFSFHGSNQQFLQLVDAYDWDFCQIQYNYLDISSQAGKSGLEYAHKKSLPVIVMEPLRGGQLIRGLPTEAKNFIVNSSDKKDRNAKKEKVDDNAFESLAAELAFSWLLNHKEINVILSGMSTEEQLLDNVRIFEKALPGTFAPEDEEEVIKIREIINRKIKVPCTGCLYCMPCPFGVDIPSCFLAYNEKYTLKKKGAQFKYMQATASWLHKPGSAGGCTNCGACIKLCPQQINIPAELLKVKNEFEGLGFKIINKVYKLINR
ncbi:MAG: aldo/keto reductase [Anaerovoracaceae bacterium]